MSEKSENENTIVKLRKLLEAQITDPELKSIDNVIQEYAPEIAYLYQFREDETEVQQTKTGYLQENRVLGVILKFYLEGKDKIVTVDVGKEYKKYFKPIARSTTSSYLNALIRESILFKERDGRNVSFIFTEKPPEGIKHFWFTRIFCIVPAYFGRAKYFSNLYSNAEKYVQEYNHDYSTKSKEILTRNFKFILGLIILHIFKNRSSSCVPCQFGKREIYEHIEETISVAIKDRSDVLPEDLVKNLIIKYSELPVFNGTNIKDNDTKEKITKEILWNANAYRKDLKFQIMVSQPRKELRLKQRKILEEQTDLFKKIKDF